MRITIETDESNQTKETSATTVTSVSPEEADNAGPSSADEIPGVPVGDTQGGDAQDAGAPPQWLVDELERARSRDDAESLDAGAMSPD